MLARRVFLAASAGAALSPAWGQDPALPTYREGDTWSFRRPHRETNETEECSETVVHVGRSRITLAVQQADSRLPMHLPHSLELSPMFPKDGELQSTELLQFPLTRGRKWRAAYDNPYIPSRDVLNREVVGTEVVNTPAGTFDCIRVESSGFWTNYAVRSSLGHSGRIEQLYWYATAAKRIVKYEARYKATLTGRTEVVAERSYELLSFRLQG